MIEFIRIEKERLVGRKTSHEKVETSLFCDTKKLVLIEYKEEKRKMKKVLKLIKNNLLGLVLGVVIGGCLIGLADNILFSSSEVGYSNTNSAQYGATATTVEGALNELYEKANNQLPKMSNMCPGCKFTYTISTWYLSSHNSATVLTDDQISALKTNWEDVVVANSKKNFLGLVVNSSTKKIDRAFACSINNGVPFCIEGVKEGDARQAEVYAANVALLQSAPLYNNGCDDYGSIVDCAGSVYAYADSDGNAQAYGDSGYCYVGSSGSLRCLE